MRRPILSFCFLASVLGTSAAAAEPTVIPGFREQVVMSGLTDPTSFAFLPDGRVIVTQKDGRLFLVVEGRPLTSAMLTLQPSEENERGVSGVTVDPSFVDNGYIYVYYTTSAQSCFGRTCDQASRAAAQDRVYPGPKNRVSRFTLVGDAVDPDSETVILDGIPSDSGYHNAGCMAFGPDGYLYLTTGDGGEAAVHAQDLSSLSGKVLRIAADGSVPADNPYVGVPGARGEIWSLGFRNPWKFTFDEGGRLLVGDVGENAWEEVNIVTRGGNYGWPWFEGPELTGDTVADENLHGGYAMVIGHVGDFFPFVRGAYYDGALKTEKNAPHHETTELIVGSEWHFHKRIELTVEVDHARRRIAEDEVRGTIVRGQVQLNY